MEGLEARLLLTASVYDAAGVSHAGVSHAGDQNAATLPAPYLPQQHNLQNLGGFLSGPRAGKPLDVAKQYLTSHAASLGLTAGDLANYVVTDQYTDADTGVTHIYLRQTLNGLEISNANLTVSVMRDGRVLNVAGGFVGGLTGGAAAAGDAAAAAATTVPWLPGHGAVEALQHAASSLGLRLSSTPTVLTTVASAGTVSASQRSVLAGAKLDGAVGDTVLTAPGASGGNVPAKLGYVWTPNGVKLTWNLVIDTADHQHWYDASVDASAGGSGAMLAAADWVDHYSESYDVWPLPVKSPDDGTRSIVTDPASPTYSPYGWHDTNGVAGAEYTYTRGNNAYAYLDRDANNSPDTPIGFPDGGSTLTFDSTWDPTQLATTTNNQATAVMQLFYLNNMAHDIHAAYGFTEAAGNFQVMNYSGQGTGNDPVLAEAQDGSGTDNANFATPPDGSSGRMQMYLYTQTTPGRDGDLEADTVLHEYGHGVSNRLTGGPSNASALTATQSGGMGEGWSDWFGLMFTQQSTDSKNLGYGHTTYTGGKPASSAGNRHYPYSYNMTIDPTTFSLYGGATFGTEVHNTGELWCAALWDMTWLLIDKYGYGSNFAGGYSATTAGKNGGNNLAMKLVEDAMKLQPANPSFVDARNAIIAADQALNGGQDLLQIWQAFARRGLGYSAVDSSANATTITPAFDIPPSLQNPRVVSQSPTGTQTSAVSTLSFTFSKAMDPTSFSLASDVVSFTGPGGVDLRSTITGSAWGSGNTVLIVGFTPVSKDGQYQMVIGPQILDTAGNPMDQNGNATAGEPTADQYTAKFGYDSVPLVVTGTTPAAGSVVSLPLTTIDVTFNEAFDASTLSASDLTLSTGTVTGATAISPTVARFAVSGLTSEGTLTASIAAGAVNDVDGNPLSAAFSGTYSLDAGTVPFPGLSAVNPLGSLVFSGSTAAGIGYAGDTDAYTISIDAGQSLSVIATPTGTGLRPTLLVKDSGGNVVGSATAAAAEQPAYLQALAIAAAGTYTIVVGSADTAQGAYTLAVNLNAVSETENLGGAGNDTIATAQNIDGAFTGLPPIPGSGRTSSRAAVLGSYSPGTGAGTTLLSTDFESGLGGFTIDNGATNVGLWHLSTGRGSQTGHTSTHSLYFGTGETASGGGNYSTGGRTTGTVTSPSILLPTTAPTSVSFNYVLQTEGSTSWDLAQLQVSTDGGATFTTLASYNGSAESSTWKAATPVSLAAYAGKTVQLRWSFDTVDSVGNTYEGWYVDDIKVLVSPPSNDYFAFTMAAGDSVSLGLKGLSAGVQDLKLYDGGGNVLASSASGPTNLDRVINDYVAPTSGTYYAWVTGPAGVNYNLVVARNASLDNEGNDTTATAQTVQPVATTLGRRVLGHVDSGNADVYKITVANAGDTIKASTATPGDGPGEPTNTLNPRLRILNASGTQVAIDDNSAADGRNAVVSYVAPSAGTYYVEVSSTTATSTTGDYTLDIAGAASPAFVVTSTVPAANATVTVVPTSITVTFNDAVLSSSLQASDLTIDGVAAATAVLSTSLTSVTFTPSSAIGQGLHTLAIAGGALVDLQGTPVTAYTSQFTVSAPPHVIGSSVKQGDVVSPGSLTYAVTFDKPMLAANLDASDFTLAGALAGTSYAPVSYSYNASYTVLTITYANLPQDNYTLTLLSGPGHFQDASGLDLDGEPVWPLGVSGNGVAGGNFFVNFTADVGTAAMTVPFTQRLPLGSGICDQTLTGGAITAGSDVDSYTVSLAANQVLSVVMKPTSAGLTPVVGLYDSGNNQLTEVTAAAAGSDAVIQAYSISSPGTYTIRASSAGGTVGTYTVQAILNAATENEAHGGPVNDPAGSAEDLSNYFTSVGNNGSVAAVAGTLETGQLQAVASENFENGYLDGNVWSTYSSDSSLGQIQVTGANGTGGGSYALIMDHNDPNGATYNLNEAIWQVNLNGSTQATLNFKSISFSDENDTLPTKFTGHANGDGIAISTDGGTTWYTVWQGSLATTTWASYSVDLVKAAAASGVQLNGGQILVKFQQYDNYPVSTDGRGFDDISVSAPAVGRDQYSFYLDTGETIALALNRLTGAAGQTLTLYGPEMQKVATGSTAAGLEQLLSMYTATEGGTYTVAVEGPASTYYLFAARKTTLDLEPNDTFATAQVLGPSGVAIGGLTAGNDDYYRFAVQAGSDVTFTTSTPGSNVAGQQFNNTLDPRLEIYDPSGNLVASDDNGAGDGRNASVSFTAGASGYYRVRVTSVGGTVGEYGLTGYGMAVNVPDAPDLVAASDSGVSSTDDITNVNGKSVAPTFTISNTTPGATVVLYANGTEVGRVDATDVVTTITLNAGVVLSDGVYAFTATQILPGQAEGLASAPLMVTIDTTPPAPPSAPDLDAGSDSGFSSTDNVTNVLTPTFNLTGGGPYYRLYYNGTTQVGGAYLTGPQFTVSSIPLGVQQVTATAVDAAGNESAKSGALAVTVDTTAPTATSVSAPNVTSGGTSYTFSVTFGDDNAIDVASLGTGDVVVTGPNSFTATATLVSVSNGANGTPRTATYSITPPGGSWDSADNGTYTIKLVASQVRDVAGNYAAAVASVGTFSVNVPLGPPPGAPDLLDAADSGILATDNLTAFDNSSAAKALQFSVAGVAAGTTVTLYMDGTAVGSAVSSGSSVTVGMSGTSKIADGVHSFTARQQPSGGAQSGDSTALLVTIDTTSAAAGVVDTSFGTGGSVATKVGAVEDKGWAIATMSDGRFIEVGSTGDGSTDDVVIVRYNANGSLDPTFGTGGKVVANFLGNDDATSVAIQADGKILVGGQTRAVPNGNSIQPLLARFNFDGSIDTTFGSGGSITKGISSSVGSAGAITGVKSLSGGKILIASNFTDGTNHPPMGVARLNADGSMDTTFGVGGVAGLSPSGVYGIAESVAVQADGKIVVGGYYGAGSSAGFALARFNGDGTPDTSFGTGGGLLASAPIGLNYISDQVAIQTDGKIVIGAGGNDPGFADSVLLRVNADGSPDNTFGSKGFVVLSLGTGNDVVTQVLSKPDGKLLVLANAETVNGPHAFTLARMNSDGSLDATFATGGIARTTIGSMYGYSTTMALDAAGGIVLGGFASNGTILTSADPTWFAAARYFDNGVPSISLKPASDTGVSSTDGITSATTLAFDVSHPDPYFRLYRNGVLVSSSYATGSVTTFTGQPAGTWVYTLTSVDAAGNETAASPPATVTIDTAPPTVTGSSLGNVTTAGGSVYTFTVTYADDVGLDASSFDGADLRVTGPNGFDQMASVLSVDKAGNGTPRTVTYTVKAPGTGWSAANNGTYTVSLQGGQVRDVAGNTSIGATVGSFSVAIATAVASVKGRYVFYNNSYWTNSAAGASHDLAIATDKSALLPGGTATFANYTSYDKGINGLMIDVSGLADGANLSAGDFAFKVGNDGTPSGWATLGVTPTVVVRAGQGVGGSDRVELVFPDGSITGQWLQVTVKAGAHTGLTADDVFYFGNAVGDSGNSTTETRVNSGDEVQARLHPRTLVDPAPVDFAWDYNRDGRVNSGDEIVARLHPTTLLSMLQLITAPAGDGGVAVGADVAAASASVVGTDAVARRGTAAVQGYRFVARARKSAVAPRIAYALSLPCPGTGGQQPVPAKDAKGWLSGDRKWFFD